MDIDPRFKEDADAIVLDFEQAVNSECFEEMIELEDELIAVLEREGQELRKRIADALDEAYARGVSDGVLAGISAVEGRR